MQRLAPFSVPAAPSAGGLEAPGELWIMNTRVALSAASIFVRFEFLQSIYSMAEKPAEWTDELRSCLGWARSLEFSCVIARHGIGGFQFALSTANASHVATKNPRCTRTIFILRARLYSFAIVWDLPQSAQFPDLVGTFPKLRAAVAGVRFPRLRNNCHILCHNFVLKQWTEQTYHLPTRRFYFWF